MPFSDVKILMKCPNPKLTDLVDHAVERRQSMFPRAILRTRDSEEIREIVMLRDLDSVGHTGILACGTIKMPDSRGVEDLGNINRRVGLE